MADEAYPVDFLPNHPPRTELEQLQAALDAGLITPALFALAKEKLLNASAPPSPETPPQPPRPSSPPAPQSNETGSGELPPLMSFFNETAPTPAPPPTPAPARVTPPPAPSQPEVRPSSPPIFRAELPPVAPAPRQPVAPPAPKPPAPPVDFLGASATPAPTAAAPRPAPTPPPNFIPSQPDVYSDLLTTAAPTPPPPSRPAAPVQPAAEPAPRRSVMPKVLLALGVVGLLLLIFWQVSGSHPDEQLTSPRLPASSESAVVPAAKAPSAKKRSTKSGKLKKRKGKKNKQVVVNADSVSATPPADAVQPQAKPTVAAAAAKPTSPARAASASVGTEAPPPDAVPRAVPPAPEAGDTEAALKVRATMAGYYADMLAPPFTAARHFAPRVERLYIQQNLTPADIDDRFNRNFFPDNKKAVLQIEPGTLRVSAPAADGTCMATFVEDSYVYHPSRQLYQRMRAQVRARFDADFKIIYLRQERLLESTVE